MLYTRNARSFREDFKEDEARNDDESVDIDFVSTLHPNKKRREKGFAYLLYGARKGIGGFLRSSALNVAADQQAIYELVQNADDSSSTFLSVNYNEDYLLCINNGNYFSNSNMAAIINVGESDKEGEDIGTFGIGFKIIHRLVGVDDGLDAIMNDYAGPIIFSWSNSSQLSKFLNGEEVQVEFGEKKDKNNPWLVKIIYTCFPCSLNEQIRLKNYETRSIGFDKKELAEMRKFISGSLKHINLQTDNNLETGSIFFLKLGKGKHKFIDEGINNLKSGISFSFNYLNSLEKIHINGEEITKQKLQSYKKEYTQDSDEFSQISPRNQKRNVKFCFSYYPIYKDGIKIANLDTEEYMPNFYNFFSMDEEKNGFRFLVHCNAFDMNNDRRKLQPDSQINERLLPVIANDIIKYIDSQKDENIKLFYTLYASLLLSKEPTNKIYLNDCFFRYLKEYLQINIPTKDGFLDSPQNVKIKDTALNISLSDIGLFDIDWFYWSDKKDSSLIKEALSPEKLGLETWNVCDIIEKSDIEKLNEWISKLSIENHALLLSELNKVSLRSETKEKLKSILLFKFSDNNFYSVDEIDEYEIIFNTNKTVDIKNELEKLGFITSKDNISKYNGILDAIQSCLPNDEELYQQIADKCVDNELNAIEKKRLFINFIEKETKFIDVGREKLKNLCLFCNSNGDVCKIKDLVLSTISVPAWLNVYKIEKKEYFDKLKSYLIKEEDIYQQIIIPYWDNIIDGVNDDISNFYEKVKFYYNLNENNTPLKVQKYIYIDSDDGFLSKDDDYFFNSKMNELEQYQYFQNAIQSLLEVQTPPKQILSYFTDDPFKVDNSDLFDYNIIETKFELKEISTIIKFCELNNERFFKYCIIGKKKKDFFLYSKNNDLFQISTSNIDTRKFIEQNCANELIILPSEFKSYNSEEGIIKNEDVYNKILDCVDVDDFKDELIDIVKYKAKYEFISKLSEFIFSSDKQYVKDDYEYKILDLACQELKENDLNEFRSRIKIRTTNNKIFKLSEIPPLFDKIQIDGKDLNLVEILPNRYQNSNLLSSVIETFVVLGLQKEKLNKLFGVQSVAEPDAILELLLPEKDCITLENEQQLAFVLLYNKCIKEIYSKFEKINVSTLDGKIWKLQYDYYTQPFSFIGEDYLLIEKFMGIEKLIDIPFSYNENKLLTSPYFEDDQFICPCLKSELSDKEKIDLITFVFTEWKKKPLIVEAVEDWSSIDEEETIDLLGFNPNICVFPSKYALDEEVLPDYFINWIGKNKEKISFISKVFKVWTDKSTIVDLRMFFLGEKPFKSNRIAQESIFNHDETGLVKTFEWLKINDNSIQNEKQFEVFNKMIEIINSNRDDNDLIIETNFDLDKMINESKEWSEPYYKGWKEKNESKFSIYLYQGKLPQRISLDEISGYIFYEYSEGNIFLSDSNIYINCDIDIKNSLSLLVSEDNDFNVEDLLLLYQSKESVQPINNDTVQQLQNKLEELQNENEMFRKRIADLEGASGTVSYNATVSSDTSYHTDIQKKSECYLFKLLKDTYENVRWLNYNEEEDFFEENWGDHDFEIVDKNGDILHYIDCKGTPSQKETFYLTNNEWEFFLKCVEGGKSYQIYRIYNVKGKIKHLLINNLLEWLKKGKVVPYLNATETIKGGRVFLTIK